MSRSIQQSCPTCAKPIDPTHAPVARIRGGKIVTFCSADCSAGKPAASTPAVATPAPAVATPTAKSPVASKKSVKKSAEKKRKSRESIDDAWSTDPLPSPKADSSKKAGSSSKVEPAEKAEPTSLGDAGKGAVPAAAATLEPAAKTLSAISAEKSGPSTTAASEAEIASLSLKSSGRKKGLIGLCAVLVAGGAALVVIDGVSASKNEPSSASVDPATNGDQPSSAKLKTTAGASAEEPAPRTATPEILYDRAVATLTELRASPSRRIERLSTMALARIGDAKAIEGLKALLASEKSSLNRIALAYALARASDEAGRVVLIEGLTHDRRDVRSDAAIALLNLGDNAGHSTLSRMTNLRHYKISACGHLARAGDEKAKILLEKVYNNSKEDQETILRAAVALGRAGDKSVAKYLKGTLADGRFQVGAADALAALGDTSAVEPLTGQLELNAMRVRAALALRRLDAKVPLGSLGVALTEDDEVTRVTAAEAILILTGPKELATRD